VADAPNLSPERLLGTFLDLVRIDSPSLREGACAEFCARELRAAGCAVRFDGTEAQTGSDTGNLVAELPGTMPGVLVLSAHLDCVEPCVGVQPVVADGVVRSSGTTVLGADDKVGLAAIIEAMRAYAESDAPRPAIRAVLSVAEEVGLVGAKALAAKDVAGDLCLVLDADGAPGGIVIAAPTHYTFTALFTGRASHAGVAPEEGLSAIRLASDAVGRMTLGRIDDATTANVGTINGGTATNVIPEAVLMTGECRSLDRDRVESVRSQIDAALHAAAEDGGGSVEVVWKLEYESFSFAEDSTEVSLVSAACERVGLTPRTVTTGGGSDTNIIAALGVPTLALSCGMREVHSVRESVRVADLEAMCALVCAVAAVMAERGE